MIYACSNIEFAGKEYGNNKELARKVIEEFHKLRWELILVYLFINHLNSLSMKKLLYYIYYRIAHAYQIFDDEFHYGHASFILFTALCCLFLAFMAFLFSLIGLKFNLTMIYIVAAIFIIFAFIFISKKKYKELEKEYADEQHKKIKGWLVFLFIIMSVILYFVSLYVFKM